MRLPIAMVFLLWSGLSAQAQTPIPPFTGEHLYVSGVGDAFNSLRGDIEQVQSQSRQSYYMVIVDSTGNGQWATRDYVDRLYQQWTRDAAQRGLTLDELRSVIILLAETNRQISLHFGSELQSKYGLVGATINTELVDPLFLPQARAGNYREGLRALLQGTEQWIQRRDADEKHRQEEIARRAAEVRHNAEATLSAADELQALAQKELDASRTQGFDVEGFAAQLAAEKPRLDAARGNLAADSALALDSAKQSQQKLQSLVDQLRQLPAIAAEVAQATRQLHDGATALASRIEQTARTGLPAQPAELRLARLRADLTAAANLGASKPVAAQETVSRLEAEARDIGRWLDELPQLQQQYATAREAAVTGQQELTAEIERAAPSGTDVSTARRQLADGERAIARAQDQAGTDLAAAIATVQEAGKELRTASAELRSQHARHVWLTRTLPLTLLAILAALVLAAAGLRWWWYQRRRRKTTLAFDQFRVYATELLDRLETLKKRHQLLPFSDTDYSESLTGETLAFYDKFDQVHHELRQQWLALMEQRQRLELLLQSANVWRASPLREADQQLAAWDKDPTEQAYRRCDEHLQRLEQAHEQARHSQQVLTDSLQRLGQRIEAIRSEQLETARYEKQLQEFRQCLEAVSQALQTDPISATQAAQELLQRTTELEQHCDQLLQQAESAQQLKDRLATTRQLAAETRAQGFTFQEENSDPDPLLASAQQLHEAARGKLNAGDVPAAIQQLQHGFELVERAAGGIRAQVEAQEFCRQRTPECERAGDQLRSQLARGRQDQQQLEQQFATESWSDVGHAVATADKSLDQSLTLLQESRANTADKVQRYLKARGQLERAEALQQQVAELLQSVRTRVEELEQLRDESQIQRRAMQERAEATRQWLAQHEQLVGDAARELLGVAQRSHEQVDSGVNQTRPHWPAIRGWIEQALANYDRAQQRATEDVRSHQEFRDRLQTVRAESQRVEQLLRSTTADRPRANQRFQTAASELALLADHANTGQRDWQNLLRRLEQVAADLQRADAWAREDVRLAQQAAAELREAEHEIDAAGSFFVQGIAADVRRAQGMLAEARQRYQAQDYEQAIQLADQAELTARQAAAEAQQRAEQRRLARELEQRRRAAATAASLPTITLGGSGFPSSRGSSPSSSPSSSSSSNQSWSSGSSQRSW